MNTGQACTRRLSLCLLHGQIFHSPIDHSASCTDFIKLNLGFTTDDLSHGIHPETDLADIIPWAQGCFLISNPARHGAWPNEETKR